LQAKPELAGVNQKDLGEQLAMAERARKMRDVGRGELRILWSEQLTTGEAENLRRIAALPRDVEPESETVPRLCDGPKNIS
jgi:hypothetical protein